MSDSIQFEISIDAGSHGWADVCITSGRTRIVATCSHVGDSLGEIVHGLARLAHADGSFEVACDSENRGVVRLRFRRASERFELVATKTPNEPSAARPRQHQARLRYSGDWLLAARAFAAAVDALLERVGVDGYSQSWGHPFPADAFAALKQAAGQ